MVNSIIFFQGRIIQISGPITNSNKTIYLIEPNTQWFQTNQAFL